MRYRSFTMDTFLLEVTEVFFGMELRLLPFAWLWPYIGNIRFACTRIYLIQIR